MAETRRMRTINQTVKFLKELDPDTAIAYSTIKKAVDSKEIPHINVGTRCLIVLEDVYEYFYKVPLVSQSK